MKLLLEKIISGGQTGIDRAALDFAIEYGIGCGGWCPRDRKAEDGPIPIKYPLKETDSAAYPVRTEKNITDSDGTMIIYNQQMDRGSSLTQKLAKKLHKPLLTIDLQKDISENVIFDWLMQHQIRILNIAGPRESHTRGIYKLAYSFLKGLFL